MIKCLVAFLCLLPFAGCNFATNKIPADARTILEKAETFELLSLEPKRLKEVPKDSFHGWKVLGKETIDIPEIRKKLVDALEKGVAENQDKGIVVKCFNPRHGIRVKHNGKAADFVICFECLQVKVYVDGGAEQTFLVSSSPAETFNKVLKDAGVALPEQQPNQGFNP
jgi:hypothetical protein